MSNKTETEISRPIQVKDNSQERVAFDLMELIARREVGSSFDPDKQISAQQGKREYWLSLYAECVKTVKGY